MKGEQECMRKDLKKRPNGRSQKLQGVNNKLRAWISKSCVSGKLNTPKEVQDYTADILSQLVLHKGSIKPSTFVLPQSSPLLTTGAFWLNKLCSSIIDRKTALSFCIGKEHKAEEPSDTLICFQWTKLLLPSIPSCSVYSKWDAILSCFLQN